MRMRKKRNLESRVEACSAVNLGWLQDYASEMRGENTELIEYMDHHSRQGSVR